MGSQAAMGEPRRAEGVADAVRSARSYWLLRRRCRRLAESLSLPEPFDITLFLERLGKSRGRPIDLVPIPVRPTGPCGLLATTDAADYILYTTDTTAVHQQHILLHEIAHLLCGHHGAPASRTPGVAALVPHLPAALIQRVLGRTVYTEPQEQEAELLASFILYRVGSQARGAAAAPERAEDMPLCALLGIRHRGPDGHG